jgi:transcriptional antiterminator NusG
MPERWYVLQTFPNKERKVMRTFRDRGISAYHPVIRKTKMVRGRRIDTVEPLFGGVIFIPDFQARAGGVRVEGVEGYFRMGDCYPYLLERDPSGSSVQDMAWVRGLERFGNIPVARRYRLFKTGQLVRVLNGPFRHFSGVIDRLDSKGRLTVFLSIFSRMTPVELEEGQIEAA